MKIETYNHARQMMERGEYEEAAALFETNIREEPHFKDLELLGECLVKLGRLPEAIVPLAAAAALNNGVRAPAMLADVFLQREQFVDAARLVGLALQRDPMNRQARRVLQKLEAPGHANST